MKNRKLERLRFSLFHIKIFNKTKITIFILLLSAFNVFSKNNSVKRFSFNFNNAAIVEVIDYLKENSDYKFFYTTQHFSSNEKISIKVKNEDINSVVKKLIKNKNLDYKIKNDYVIISTKTDVQKKKKHLIQGRVLDDKEPPQFIPGATVKIKGGDGGTLTDEGGYFKIEAHVGDIIEFSFIGYKSKDFIVSGEISNLSISLAEDVEALDEVVVTGYSEERKMNMISSISSLKVEANLQTKPVTAISQALQGGITGITVTQSSGLPGADAATIKIRGISTLGESNPLVLVDGIPMKMDNLDPNTIKSVTVLKDAAAAAIYGARASNGVIVIKTKRGKAGKVRLSYNTYYGIQKATYLPDFVNAPTYMRMVNQAYKNIGGDPVYQEEVITNTENGTDPVQYPNTNWKDYIYKDGSLQSHSLSVSGGNSLARFSLSANYQHQTGLIDNTDFNRLSIRANTSVTLSKTVSVNMDFNSYRRERNEAMYRSGAYSSSILNYMSTTPPNIVSKYPMKEGSDMVYYGNAFEMRNPAAMIERGGKMNQLEDNVSINIQPKWEIIPNLNLKGQYSYRVSSTAKKEEREAFNFFDYDTGNLFYTWGAINSASKGRSSYVYIGSTLDYTIETDNHRLYTIAGYNQELTNSGDWDQWSLRSYFMKANYTFDRRYLLEATIRIDGSSRFDSGNKYGKFPSIGAGWNVHEESFMKSFKFLDNFKLRASYGQLGNENIGLYKYQSLVNSGNGVETVYGNPNITWETLTMANIGTDIGLFKDLTLSFDYYDKLTTDMIITPPISYIGGIGSSPLNSGEVRNKGWELDLNYSKTIKDLTFNVHLGLSHNENKIEKLFGAPYDNGSKIHEVGYSLHSHYRYKTSGLLQEDDFTGKDGDGNWIPKEGVVVFDGQQPGDIHYLDQNGDKKIDSKDRVIMNDSQPDYNYFSNLSVNYKNWSFEVLLQGVTGVDAYYSGRYAMGLNVEGDGGTPIVEQKDYWSPENTGARYPRITPSGSYGHNNEASDYWHFDASYCRVKYMQLGYTFDRKLTNKFGVSGFRLYLNAQNVFTFADEKVTDPESRG